MIAPHRSSCTVRTQNKNDAGLEFQYGQYGLN